MNRIYFLLIVLKIFVSISAQSAEPEYLHLHYLIAADDDIFQEELQRFGPNASSSDGATSLHLAAVGGFIAKIQIILNDERTLPRLLMNSGAGTSAIDLSIESENYACAELIANDYRILPSDLISSIQYSKVKFLDGIAIIQSQEKYQLLMKLIAIAREKIIIQAPQDRDNLEATLDCLQQELEEELAIQNG